MATEVSTQRELQEKSIKARKHELFVDDAAHNGPRRAFREYLRETPAAPLSRNVKLILWASAVPVALLFVAAMVTVKGSTAKAPKEMIIPLKVQSPPTPGKIHLVENNHDSTPNAAGSKSENPPEKKKKPTTKKKNKRPRKAQPKKVEVAKTDEAARDNAEEPSRTDEEKTASKDSADEDKDKDEKAKDEKAKDEKAKDEKAKDEKAKDAKAKSKSKTSKPSPPKPPRRKESIFRKKKAPIPSYPKREPTKKDEPKPNPAPLRPGLIEITPDESGRGTH